MCWAQININQFHDPSAVPLGSTPVPIEQEAVWSRESVWMFWKTQNSLAAAESQSPERAAHSLVTTLTELFRLPLSQYDTQNYIREYKIDWFCKPWTRLYLFVVNAGLFFMIVFFYYDLLPTLISLNVTTTLACCLTAAHSTPWNMLRVLNWQRGMIAIIG